MKYTIYQTRNLINEKIYVGKHETNNPNDDYLGSGKILLRAIEKYGLENFKKKILYIYDTREEMNQKEMEIVDEDFVSRDNTYNIKVGGTGGFDYINNTGLNGTKSAVRHRKILLEHDPEWTEEFNIARNRGLEKHKETISDEEWTRRGKKANETMLRRYGKYSFEGKKHTEETKQLMRESRKGKGTGKKNSQYGTCWIHNNRVSKKIDKDDLDEYLIEGWIKGRKIKF